MKRVPLDTWLVTAAVAAVLLWGFGCASVKAASEHATQIGIGTAAGGLVGLFAVPGANFLAILLVAAVGAAGAILSAPECPPQSITNITGPGAHVAVRAVEAGAAGIPTWIWIWGAATVFVVWHVWKHGDLIRDAGWIKGILKSLGKVKVR